MILMIRIPWFFFSQKGERMGELNFITRICVIAMMFTAMISGVSEAFWGYDYSGDTAVWTNFGDKSAKADASSSSMVSSTSSSTASSTSFSSISLNSSSSSVQRSIDPSASSDSPSVYSSGISLKTTGGLSSSLTSDATYVGSSMASSSLTGSALSSAFSSSSQNSFSFDYDSTARSFSIASPAGNTVFSSNNVVSTSSGYAAYGLSSDNMLTRFDFSVADSGAATVNSMWISQSAVDPKSLYQAEDSGAFFTGESGNAKLVLFNNAAEGSDSGTYLEYKGEMKGYVDGDARKNLGNAIINGGFADDLGSGKFTMKLASEGEDVIIGKGGQLFQTNGSEVSIVLSGDSSKGVLSSEWFVNGPGLTDAAGSSVKIAQNQHEGDPSSTLKAGESEVVIDEHGFEVNKLVTNADGSEAFVSVSFADVIGDWHVTKIDEAFAGITAILNNDLSISASGLAVDGEVVDGAGQAFSLDATVGTQNLQFDGYLKMTREGYYTFRINEISSVPLQETTKETNKETTTETPAVSETKTPLTGYDYGKNGIVAVTDRTDGMYNVYVNGELPKDGTVELKFTQYDSTKSGDKKWSDHYMYIKMSDLRNNSNVFSFALDLAGCARNEYIGKTGSVVSDPIDVSKVKAIDFTYIGDNGAKTYLGALDYKKYDEYTYGVESVSAYSDASYLTLQEARSLYGKDGRVTGKSTVAGVEAPAVVDPTPSGNRVLGVVDTFRDEQRRDYELMTYSDRWLPNANEFYAMTRGGWQDESGAWHLPGELY